MREHDAPVLLKWNSALNVQSAPALETLPSTFLPTCVPAAKLLQISRP
jgi:hypothetical protein